MIQLEVSIQKLVHPSSVMAVMKAMKAMKGKPMKATAMKAMKAMKVMKVSKIAKGKRARAAVFSGMKEKTQSGLKKTDLIKSKRGKIVSKKSSAAAKKKYQGSKVQKWIKCCTAARKQLNIKGFVAFNKGPEGKALYAKAKSLYAKET